MKFLTEIKTCATCGATFDRVPAGAREGLESRDEFPGFYWECSCKSTMFVPTSKIDPTEYCDCADCQDSDVRCAMDCDDCAGCREALAEYLDTVYEIDHAQGRR